MGFVSLSLAGLAIMLLATNAYLREIRDELRALRRELEKARKSDNE